MKEKKRHLLGVIALFSALVFSNGHLFQLPDFLAGFLVGFSIVLMILLMLPDQTLEKLKRWKRHG